MQPTSLEIATLLLANERLMAEFYRACAEKWPELADDLRRLADEEEAHARVIEKLVEEIRFQPRGWQAGAFDRRTIEVVAEQMREVMREIESGKVDGRYAITRITSIEDSLYERHLDQSLVCSDPKLLQGLRAITNDFARHAARLRAIHQRIFG